jgi:hypothetical protein
MFDLHRVIFTASERAFPYLIQFGFGTVSTGVLTGTYTELVYDSLTAAGELSIQDIMCRRYASGTKVWARALCPGQDTGTITFMVGIHEYDETQENDFTIDSSGWVKSDTIRINDNPLVDATVPSGANPVVALVNGLSGYIEGDGKIFATIFRDGGSALGFDAAGGSAKIISCSGVLLLNCQYQDDNIEIRDFHGRVILSDLLDTFNVYFYDCEVVVEIGASCTGGSVILDGGSGAVVDGSSGAVSVTKTRFTDADEIDTIIAKLPTNYIMGSSVQTAKDDEIDTLVTDMALTKGYAEDAKTASEGLEAKAPANYIMGSSDNADHDTQIDLIDAALRMAIEYDFTTYSKAVILFYEDDRPLAGDPSYWAYVYTAAGGKPSTASEITKRDRLKTWVSGAPS